MDDAGGRRNDAEVVERVLSPLEELVALEVPLELALAVAKERFRRTEVVDLHGVVDDEVTGDERIDARRIASHPLHRAPHRGEVDDRGHPGEVLEDDPSRHERNLGLPDVLRVVGGDGPDVLFPHDVAVEVPKGGLEQHLDAVRQASAAPVHGIEAPNGAVPEWGGQSLSGGEGICGHGPTSRWRTIASGS